jgi:hypothetical protein
MGLNSKLGKTVGLALATSANGTTRNGATLSLMGVQPGQLSVKCQSQITTSSVLATFTMQVSDDGTNWYDVKLANNAAIVNTAAGTGSPVTTSLCLVPGSLGGWSYFRVNAVLSGASTAAADKTQVDYRFVKFPL